MRSRTRKWCGNVPELSSAALRAFWTDVQRSGRAIAATYEPPKIDYFVMGDRMPQLHRHVLPRPASDDPKRNVDISDGPRFLRPDALRRAAADLHDVWDEDPPGR